MLVHAHNLFMLARDSNCGTTRFGIGSAAVGLYDNLCSGGNVDIQSVADVSILIANVVRILFAAAGALAVVFIMVGGIFYVISSGDPSRISRAKEIITQAITGLVVVVLAYALVTFIAQSLSK